MLTTPNPAEKLAKLRAEHRATRYKGEADRTKVAVRLATGWTAQRTSRGVAGSPPTWRERNQFTCYREGGIHYSLFTNAIDRAANDGHCWQRPNVGAARRRWRMGYTNSEYFRGC